MTNAEIKSEIFSLCGSERAALARLLELITLSERLRIFAEDGYGSAKRWLVAVFGYSESPANQRLQASRFSREFPEALELVRGGDVTLTTLFLLRGTLEKEERRTSSVIARESKLELLKQICGKTETETQIILANAFPDLFPRMDNMIPIGSDEVALNVVLTTEQAKYLEEVRNIRSHATPYATWGELVGFVSRDFVTREQSRGKKTRADAGISGAKRRIVLRNANYQCEFMSVYGVRCESKFQLEADHIVPRALGGSDELSNLRCMCRTHNQFMAWKTFGAEVMDRYTR